MTKTECIDIFNAMLKGEPLSFQDKLLPLFSDYLSEKKVKNSDKLISIMVQNPQLLQEAFPSIVDFYCLKYNIRTLNEIVYNRLKPILYYE